MNATLHKVNKAKEADINAFTFTCETDNSKQS